MKVICIRHDTCLFWGQCEHSKIHDKNVICVSDPVFDNGCKCSNKILRKEKLEKISNNVKM